MYGKGQSGLEPIQIVLCRQIPSKIQSPIKDTSKTPRTQTRKRTEGLKQDKGKIDNA